jgi:hypothetical protein
MFVLAAQVALACLGIAERQSGATSNSRAQIQNKTMQFLKLISTQSQSMI